MRRLNVKLLVYLLIAVVAIVGVTTALWRVNLTRTLEAQLAAAEKAGAEAKKLDEEGKLDEATKKREEAYDLYRRYMKQEPNNAKAAASVAMIVADLAETTNTRELHALAFTTLEYALRLDGTRADVRRRLVRYTMFLNRYQDAIQHLEILLSKEPNDGELEADLAQCHAMMGDKDLAAETYKLSLEHKPDRIKTYVHYAILLKDRWDNEAEADAIVARMVEANEGSSEAWLAKAEYCMRRNQSAAASEALVKARELAPEDASVLLLSAQNVQQSDPKACEEYLNKCLELHKDEARAYHLLATLALAANDPEKAMEVITKGLEVIPNNTPLLVVKADMEVTKGDKESARATIEKLQKNRYEPEILDYLNARLLILDGSNVQAAQILQSIRPLLVRRPELLVQVDLLLARCYERLGQLDLCAETYTRILDADPNNVQAKLWMEYKAAREGNSLSAASPTELTKAGVTEPTLFQVELAKQLQIEDPAQRNWKGCEDIVTSLRARVDSMDEGESKAKQRKILIILDAELVAQKGDVDKAVAMIRELIAAEPKDVNLWIALCGLNDRKDPENGMKATLDEADAAAGQSVLLTQMRLNLAARVGGEEAVNAVLALEPKVKEFTDAANQTVLYGNMAELILANGNYDQGQRLLGLADEKAPFPDLRIRMRRFDLAFATSNQEDMQKIGEQIADLMGKDSAEYYYAEASKMVTQMIAGTMPKDQVDRARDFVKRARELRPRWPSLSRLDAQLDELNNDIDSAIVNYKKAIDEGENTKGYIIRLMQLLYVKRQYDDAAALMATLKLNDTDGALAPFEAQILYQQGKLEEALAVQQKTCETSQSADAFLFLAQLYEERKKEGDSVEAEKAHRKACELAPEVARTWTMLVAFLARQERIADAEAIIAELPAKLPDEHEHLVIAACQEMIQRGDDAEKSYAAELEKNPNSFAAQRNLAAFYARTNKLAQSEELLDKMISRAKEATSADLANLAWARRTKAQILGQAGNYQLLRQGLALVDENAQGGVLPAEDLLLKVQLLSGRADRTSRLQAIKLIEEAIQTRQGGSETTTPAEHLLLAQLYSRDSGPDSWQKAKDHMFELILSAKNPTYLGMYIRMLLDHDETSAAEGQLKALAEAAPTSDIYLDCQARYLAKTGKPEEALALIKEAIAQTSAELPNEHARILGAAGLLEDLDLNKAAEEEMKRFVGLEPNEVIRLAGFYARQGDLAASIQVCKDASATRPGSEVANAALQAVRLCIDQVKPEYFADIEGWIATARQQQSGDVIVDLLQADLYDLQGNYAEAVKSYEQILASKNLGDGPRLMALNNLAYIKAVKFNDTKSALGLIDQAMEIGGPVSELLDTKAMVLALSGNTDQALTLLSEALLDTPKDAVKLFHLARVHATAKDMPKAQEALAKAQEHGLDIKKLPVLEHDTYHSLMQELQLQ